MKTIALLIILIFLCSCKTAERVYNNASWETIDLKYDNVLIYSWRMGCIGASGPLTYTLKSDTLTVEKKVLPLGTENHIQSEESVYGQSFKHYKDSLINITTGEAFYSPSYIKKRNRQANRNFAIYIIHDGVKHRINKNNYKRSILVNLKMEDYNTTPIDVETAYIVYAIPRQYTTLQLTRK